MGVAPFAQPVDADQHGAIGETDADRLAREKKANEQADKQDTQQGTDPKAR